MSSKGCSPGRFTTTTIFLMMVVSLLSGCATYPGWLYSAGPSKEEVVEQENSASPIPVINVNDAVARRLMAAQRNSLFSETLSSEAPPGYVVGPGDVVEVSIWEAPPAALFGVAAGDSRGGASTSRPTSIPEQMVAADGSINVPFVGAIQVTGKTLQQIETEVARQLAGKAHQPQVMVRLVLNSTYNVTILGEVPASKRMPLTAKGERLLDALATAGGVRHPVDKTTIQISRGGAVQSLPLETIIKDPKQNIVLQPGDVVTALFQSLSFTVLGATGKNEEVNYEAKGISLAQALARAGGLNDARADARGVFIFRFESEDAVEWSKPPPKTPEGKVPVIYTVNLKDPATFFVAQGFPIKNKDVLYVSNAPTAELQKFLNILISASYPLLNVIAPVVNSISTP